MLDNIMEKETLPASESEKTLPTQIADLDLHLKMLNENLVAMQKQIADCNFDRMTLIARAKELHITDDGAYKIIEIPVYPKKHVDITYLKTQLPDRYALIIENVKARIADKVAAEISKAEAFISQADVKAVVRDKGMLAMCIPEPKEPVGIEVSVVRRI